MTENVSAASTAAEPKRETWGGKGLNVAIIVAAVLTVAGIACWAMQLSGGMVQTGMRNLDSWGLYITNFMFFVGLSAGGLIISSVPNCLRHEGLRRHLQGRHLDERVLHLRGNRLRRGRPRRPAACGSCSCTRTSPAP